MRQSAWLGLTLTALIILPAPAQQGAAPASPRVAAVVNGQAIPEVALERAFQTVSPERRQAARVEILDFLIDNLLVDQYLQQLKVPIEPKDIETRVEQVKGELKKEGKEFDVALKSMLLTEQELRAEIAAILRWDKFSAQHATDKAVKELFDKEPELFDGTQVRARHILLTPAQKGNPTDEQCQAQLAQMKQEIERAAADGLARLPAGTSNLDRERERRQLIEDAFAARAREKSMCPSKDKGGDVNWFPRGGSMVEAFAKAAFALKDHQISDVVKSPYGYHLILLTDRKAGVETKFEAVKEEVKEVFCDRLRAEMVRRLRPVAKISITPPAEKQ